MGFWIASKYALSRMSREGGRYLRTGLPKSYPVSKLKSSNDPIKPTDSFACPSVGSSNGPSHRSIVVGKSQPQCSRVPENSPPSASCYESSVTHDEVLKRALRLLGQHPSTADEILLAFPIIADCAKTTALKNEDKL